MSLVDHITATPKTLSVLAESWGTSRREVELEINRLRLQGVPIVTDSDGARLAQTAEEVELCVERLRRRAATQFLTARGLARAAKRLRESEQRTLWSDAA